MNLLQEKLCPKSCAPYAKKSIRRANNRERLGDKNTRYKFRRNMGSRKRLRDLLFSIWISAPGNNERRSQASNRTNWSNEIAMFLLFFSHFLFFQKKVEISTRMIEKKYALQATPWCSPLRLYFNSRNISSTLCEEYREKKIGYRRRRCCANRKFRGNMVRAIV